MNKTALANFDEEKKLWRKGYMVIGLDEVGRGSFAGPVVAAAVAFSSHDKELEQLGITDSKQLLPQTRQSLGKVIKERSVAYAISTVGVPTINRIGIGKATMMAFRKASHKIITNFKYQILPISNKNKRKKEIGSLDIGNLKFEIPKQKFFVLVDGFHIRYLRRIGLKNQKAIIKGDQKSISIAAASILAKVYRDRLMNKLHKKYPRYRFSKNKGYGTSAHQQAIHLYGLCDQHRMSFRLDKFL